MVDKELAFPFFQCINDRILAKASVVEIYIVEDPKEDKLELIIRDNGQKFDANSMNLNHSESADLFPALHYLQKSAMGMGGDFKIISNPQSGNLIEIAYPLRNPRRPALGNVAAFLSKLFMDEPQIHFIFSQISEKGEFVFDSVQFKQALGDLEYTNKAFKSNLSELLSSEIDAILALA